MKHPCDAHIEYFAFVAPDGVCVVAMVRGVWAKAHDNLPLNTSCERLLRIINSLRGEVRRMTDRRTPR